MGLEDNNFDAPSSLLGELEIIGPKISIKKFCAGRIANEEDKKQSKCTMVFSGAAGESVDVQYVDGKLVLSNAKTCTGEIPEFIQEIKKAGNKSVIFRYPGGRDFSVFVRM
ncbi:MAG: hypothetical protein Athens071426_59 [Parcubacteria group bacterium Athens0714_26]|nr:MAG: hypothetical protein Athens101426_569 [Parcubacteria group bacterium Athens1014_26]TSD03777.1 MAG: hypothetical protein Athens071426_59 [Parcubacteria group bacterium Athens0714_26]